MTKKQMIMMISIAGGIILTIIMILFLMMCFGLGKGRPPIKINEIKVAQIENQQKIKVSWNTTEPANRVIVSVKKSDGVLESQINISNPSQIGKGCMNIDASYGLNDIEVEVFNNNGIHSDKKIQQVKVFTDEYVIAPLFATLPVTLFSLQFKEITNNYTIPTFVWFTRGGVWNYDKMPENVYLIPTGSYEVMSGHNGTMNMYTKTSKWVGELYQINNNSKFHLYVNDQEPYGWLQATISNHIPTTNYDVTILSDGIGSSVFFEEVYKKDKDAAMAEYNTRTALYKEYKEQLWNQNSIETISKDKGIIKIDDARHYILQMIEDNEINVKLTLTRAFFKSNNTDFCDEIKSKVATLTENGKIKVVNLYNLLKALDDNDKQIVKSLYKFSEDMFEKAITENKKAMIILGTDTQYEANFDEYVASIKAYYGDGYVYYYKGHPFTPTAMDSKKAQHLKDIGLIDIDSTISAELIFFFNPESICTGYQSTTYNALPTEQVGGMFGLTLNDVKTKYTEFIKFVVNKFDSSNATYGSLATANSYLFEFVDNSKYDIAVYDAVGKIIKYYKNQNGSLVETSK